ncbi:Schwann cell myelin protein-like [Pseudophryne corroboree]|uniref:Schwann cell myelin protein-like n=1 Tax=Pseudophryne corroboree TaxID=495146 RepID=UPI003081A144
MHTRHGEVPVGQQREYNFPSRIQALLGSCVEIPCSFSPALTELEILEVVWHVNNILPSNRIIYSTHTNEISNIYNNRATLVAHTKEMCNLRIHKVKRQDENSYYPNDRKILFYRQVSKYVELKVTDVLPESVLSVPGETTVGEPTKITCSTNHTCASSPPSFTWNVTGAHVTQYNLDLGEGVTKALSELTYQPSATDIGSEIQCKVSFPNGQTSVKTAKLFIKPRPLTNIYIGTIIGLICIIALLGIVLFIWRKKQCFRKRNIEGSLNRKLETEENVYSKKFVRYTDLLENENTKYYIIEPTANNNKPETGGSHLQPSQNQTIYENM